MEWVETTGRTIEEAKERALDELGVDDQDAEFEVVEEPKAGLFGLVRKEARVRARVRPTQPRPKVERRRQGQGSRNRSGGGAKRRGTGGGGSQDTPTSRGADRGADDTTDAPATADRSDATAVDTSHRSGKSSEDASDKPSGSSGSGRSRTRSRGGRGNGSTSDRQSDRPRKDRQDSNEGDQMDEVTVDQQVEVMEDFLEGLVEAFGLEGQISSETVDEDVVEIRVEGDDLGLLIGPKGQTLASVQDLARAVAQRKLAGRHQGRVRVDVGGYRQRRAEALSRFAQQVAEDVLASGREKALEPMSPPDRKVVHDAINEIPGVRTISEGEDNRRRVVILPDN
jgi:spoIIIJ-associated protein